MVGWLGDTLWVADRGLYQVTFFPPLGEAHRVHRDLAGILPKIHMRIPIPTAAGGWISVRRSAESPGSDRFVEEWVSVDSAWGAVTPIMILAPSPARVEIRLTDSTGVSASGQPFSSQTLFAFAPDGRSVTLLDRGGDTPGEAPSSYSLTRTNLRGDTVFRTVRRIEPMEVRKPTVDAVVEYYVSMPSIQRSGLNALAMRDKVHEALYLPAYHPPATDVVQGADGSTWVRREDRWEATVLWDVFDREGHLSATLELDRRVQHLAPYSGGVWAVVRTDEGVRVVRYAVRRN